MKGIKKLATLALAACMSLFCMGAFASCGRQFTAEINWDVDLSKPIDINMLYPNTGLSGFGKDHTARLIEESTGYKTNYSEVAVGKEDNAIDGALNTQEKYHAMKLSQAQYDPYVARGTWLDLTELLTRTESGRILYDIIDLMPNAWDSVKYTDENGKTGIYGIPECGYTSIEEFALIWNKKHLEAIGWYKNGAHKDVPETISEVTEALRALQAHFGANNSNYHAFGLGGANYSNVENIMSAFGCANQFYVDENGDIQFYVYDDSVTNYVTYMNMLKNESILSANWQNGSEADLCTRFSNQESSCMYLTYWWVKSLCDTAVKNALPQKLGMGKDVDDTSVNTYDVVHDEVLAWRTRVRGDGEFGSEVQTAGKYISDNGGNAFYITIPFYMAEDAVYVIDYLSKKLQSYALWYGGKEDVDWKVVDKPENGEDFKNKIIYMQPWSYEIGEGETRKTVSGGGKWIQLLDSYTENIVDNSMYASGANVVEARSLFHLRETGFDAWPIAVETDDTIIRDPMSLHPTFKWWSPVSIQSRTEAKRGVASAIDNKDPAKSIELTRRSLTVKGSKVEGVKYFYWSDDICKEMTTWYKEVKLKPDEA